MFTGIVKEVGEILEISENASGVRFKVKSTELINELNIDDSIAVDGACQTVVDKGENYFCIQSVKMTLDKTTFGNFKVRSPVNLELAMRPVDRLGGHFVTGHVNGLAQLISIFDRGENREMTFKISSEWCKYLIPEGSITLNGVSLTLNEIGKDGVFKVSLIPHTLQNTNLGKLALKDYVNIEFDILIKFVENLIFSRKSHSLQTDLQSFAKRLEDEISNEQH